MKITGKMVRIPLFTTSGWQETDYFNTYKITLASGEEAPWWYEPKEPDAVRYSLLVNGFNDYPAWTCGGDGGPSVELYAELFHQQPFAGLDLEGFELPDLAARYLLELTLAGDLVEDVAVLDLPALLQIGAYLGPWCSLIEVLEVQEERQEREALLARRQQEEE